MTDKNKKISSDRLQDLRAVLSQQKLDGFIVPRSDEWQGEYVPACAERLKWMSGFTGSAGFAVILSSHAAVFSDSRYTIQMKQQVDDDLFEAITLSKQDAQYDWIASHAPKGGLIGYDPRLHTVHQVAQMKKALDARGMNLVAVKANPVDHIWADQPAPPKEKIEIFDLKKAGVSIEDKLDLIAQDLKDAQKDAFILTAPDCIAWLLNIRGHDLPNTPFVLSYAIVSADGTVDFFVDDEKMSDEARAYLGNRVSIHKLEALEDFIDNFATGRERAGQAVSFDYSLSSQWLRQCLKTRGVDFEHMADPVMARKAKKNKAEIAAIINAHIKDGVALAKFWKWVEQTAKGGALTEKDVEERLFAFRQEQDDFRENSFDPIVGWAGNGAIVHYRVSDESNADIKGDSLLLVDSGAQYGDGTTDNTRTVSVGTPTPDMKENFTRVLKGHIAIASAQFPKGTTGRDIDMLARQFLRKVGRDYGHGTGHGVGHYLSVHENGAGISSRFTKALEVGMLISNEPGYYEEGAYGIRLENLVFVEEDPNDPLMLRFNTVSLTPFDRTLIDIDLLDADEMQWLNEYHRDVYKALSPHLDQDHKDWLQKQTAPLMRAP
jgi:Xaa-Pro aminopeptidase